MKAWAKKATALLVMTCLLVSAIFALGEGLYVEDGEIAAELAEAPVGEGDTDLWTEQMLEVKSEAPSGTGNGDDADAAIDAPEDLLPIDEAHFPDPAFREYLIELFSAEDVLVNGDSISLDDAEAVDDFSEEHYVESQNRFISMRGRGVASLKGIEYFPNLGRLDCGENELTELDLSNNTQLSNLQCDANRIASLDVSMLPELAWLGCSWNRLTSLDVTHNPALCSLAFDNGDAQGGNRIEHIDLSHNPELFEIYCGNTGLKELDLSGCKRLRIVNVRGNALTELDVSGNPELFELVMKGNPVMTVDISGDDMIFAPLNEAEQSVVDGNSYEYSILGSGGWIKGMISFPIGSTLIYNGGRTVPTSAPTAVPTAKPTVAPTAKPTVAPTAKPTEAPTARPTAKPTAAPLAPGSRVTRKGGVYEIDNNGDAVFVKPAKAAKAVTIPATISVNGKKVKVTAIADKAFYKNKKLTVVTIGKYVWRVGANAFRGCVKLKTVKGGLALDKIDDYAFKGCKALRAFTLNKGVSVIGDQAFYGCGSLRSVVIKTLELENDWVGANAFKGLYAKVAFKCPKKKLKAYRALLKKKGAPKTAKYRAS